VKLLMRGIAAAIVAMIGIVAFASSPAKAVDEFPCHSPFLHKATGFSKLWGFEQTESGEFWRCPLVRGKIPVYKRPTTNSERVGTLVGGDSRNWFVEQYHHFSKPEPKSARGVHNYWWAYTLADNKQWGFVPQIYFRGGGYDEKDGGGGPDDPATTLPVNFLIGFDYKDEPPRPR
jgi:hypothetical protein